MNIDSLTASQKELMKEFYSIRPTHIGFDKIKRDALWGRAARKDPAIDLSSLKIVCPALEHQIRKKYKGGRNIQSAVFSECVYAQTLANMLNLNSFINCLEDEFLIPSDIKALLDSHNLTPRYAYLSADKKRILFQAGGCGGIDCALISMTDKTFYSIEFKEPGAKTTEPDLPKYDEDGVLVVTDKFLSKYSHFEEMLNEQKGLNFFEVMGSNVNNFTEDSIRFAVSNNYTKKYADVICTEDVYGYLVMLPANQVSIWAEISGEIRPAGRNAYKVWTPNSLNRFLKEKGALINGKDVTIEKDKLGVRKQRGGDGRISGYKINPLFFVYSENCIENNGYITFNIDTVLQLNPTIAGKMFFKNLKYDAVKNYYYNNLY